MRKNVTLLGVLLLSTLALSQVGINTEVPKATFDVTGKNTEVTVPDGIIAPRITGNELRAKNAVYNADQNAAIVYVTTADTAPSGKTINVTEAGYYYYDAANSVWKTFTNNSTEVDGVVGNEVVAATPNRGLFRSGAGTNINPYTLGLTAGGANGQVMMWNGTAWNPALITANNGLTATAGNIKLGGTLSDATTTITTNGNTNALAISGLGTVAATNKLLALDASNRLKTVDISSQFDDLGIPRPAIYQLATSGTYLSGVSIGGKESVPMVEIINKTGPTGVTFTPGTNRILFRPGLYQISFVYESDGTVPNDCALSSYFVDFPTGSSSTTRVHSTASHKSGGLQNHGSVIMYTTSITSNTSWQIQIGRGQSGDCGGKGTQLKAKSTQVSILKLE